VRDLRAGAWLPELVIWLVSSLLISRREQRMQSARDLVNPLSGAVIPTNVAFTLGDLVQRARPARLVPSEAC
jgi:hypothetical protein